MDRKRLSHNIDAEEKLLSVYYTTAGAIVSGQHMVYFEIIKKTTVQKLST